MSPIVEKLLQYGAVGLFAAIVCVVFAYYYKKQEKKTDEREKRDIAEREALKEEKAALQKKYDEDIARMQEQRLVESQKVTAMAMSYHEKTVSALTMNAEALRGTEGSLKELTREIIRGK